jgi:DNA-binding LytR/AlgR family response regulator
MKAIIIDDEKEAREALAGLLKEYCPEVHIIGAAGSAMEGKELISTLKPRLVFLDINMPFQSGFDLLQSLPSIKFQIIFTTAYEKYALQGFELEAIDFLLKPISFERFLKATNKAYDIFKSSDNLAGIQDFIFVKAENKLVKVQWDEVFYIQAMENYVVIHTNEQKIMSLMTMKSMEERLPDRKFIRIHKSYIVNAEKVQAIEGNMVHIKSTRLPISRQKRQEVLDSLVR